MRVADGKKRSGRIGTDPAVGWLDIYERACWPLARRAARGNGVADLGDYRSYLQTPNVRGQLRRLSHVGPTPDGFLKNVDRSFISRMLRLGRAHRDPGAIDRN